MLIVLIILSVGLLGVVIYFAFSRKSSRFLKLAAFVALGLIALALAIAGIFLIMGPGEGTEQIPIPLFQEAPAPERASNTMEVAAFLLFFLLVMGLIFYLTRREQHKKNEAAKKSPPSR